MRRLVSGLAALPLTYLSIRLWLDGLQGRMGQVPMLLMFVVGLVVIAPLIIYAFYLSWGVLHDLRLYPLLWYWIKTIFV